MIPPPPQTNRQAALLSDSQTERLLRKAHPADATDNFATDGDSAVRHLGRLALRRDIRETADYFALGDLCARLTLMGTVLNLPYLLKTLDAYARAGGIARDAHIAADAALAASAGVNFVEWVIAVADQHPLPRNLGAALYAVTILSPERLPESQALIARLLHLFTGYLTCGLSGTSPELGTGTATSSATFVPPALPDQGLPNQTMDAAPPKNALDPSPFQSGALGSAPDLRSDNLPTLTEGSAGMARGEASPAAHPAPPRIISMTPTQRILGEYEAGDRIAERYEVRGVKRGGMGVVYFCFDHELGDSLAIKTYQSRYLDRPTAQERFRREAFTWISLEKHPNIVRAQKVETLGEEAQYRRPHLLMELIAPAEGLDSDLSSWIDRHRITTLGAVRFAAQIAAGMQHAVRHFPHLVHRDLKPANILVNYDGVAKVTDFGLVRALEDGAAHLPEVNDADDTANLRLTHAGAIMGTILYLSPEQCRAEELDLRSDIYAFGAILYEMLTGRHLFDAVTQEAWLEAHVRRKPTLRADESARLPAALRDILFRCLAKPREERPPTWAALRDDLRLVWGDLLGEPPPDDVPPSDLTMAHHELMDKAYSLTELGYGEAALNAYDQVLAQTPTNPHVWARKGRTLRILGRYEDALAAFDQATTLPSQDRADVRAWAWNQKGIALERLRRYEAAIDAYREAQAAKRTPDAWFTGNLAGLLIKSRRPQEAIQVLAGISDADQEYPEAHRLRARALAALGEHAAALDAADRAIRAMPRASEAWITKGQVLVTMGRHAESVTMFTQAVRLAPRNVRGWAYLSSAYLSLNNPAEALYPAMEAARLKPDDYRIQARLGEVLVALGRHAEALEAFELALSLNPKGMNALKGKIAVLIALGRNDEALHTTEAAARAFPEEVPLWVAWIERLFASDRWRDALDAAEKATDALPHQVRLWMLKGRVLRALSRYEDAVEVYEHVLRVNPHHAAAWNAKGAALAELGKRDDALHCFQQATETTPTDGYGWYRMGVILIELGRYEEALRALTKAAALRADDKRIALKLNEVRRRLQGA
ncbi:MAG TPA: tetratricopeptide repeat protein [Aggregatilineales bacterium]|nr:tetratricopeptide repeat protein [Anaerolineales bacterium]HRE47161.1 tetratricopeptide repeat protein [Aggregatilineales bacterium]